MKKKFNFFIKSIKKIAVFIILFIASYILIALLCSYITVNKDYKECKTDCYEIYLKTNGVHTDIILPFATDTNNWLSQLNVANTRIINENYNYVAFGWGDKGFYLETPQWSDLKAKTAFNAMFYLSTSAMHVTLYKNMKENETCKKVRLNKVQFDKLNHYIQSSFAKDATNNFILLQGKSYSNHDYFYDAVGRYSIVKTCNTWVNTGLKEAELRACLWTPFDKSILGKYE